MWIKTRFSGVRYRESKDRKIKVKGHYRPDRCFYIYYKIAGKSINEKVGWESEGLSGEQARDTRGTIVSNIRSAKGHRSLKEKREIDKTQKEKAQIDKELQKGNDISFGSLAHKYLAWAKDSKKSYKDDESRYRNHIAPILEKAVAREINVLDIQQIKKTLSKKKVTRNGKTLAPATIKHCIVIVRQIFNYAITHDLVTSINPVSKTLKKHKDFLTGASDERTRFLSKDEAQALLSTIKKSSVQTYNICLVSLYTGLRMGEIFSLTWQDVDFENKLIHVRNPKNSEARHAYLTPNIAEVFESLSRKKSGLIFLGRNGKRIVQLSDTFNRAVIELGLNDSHTNRLNKVIPHTLRHTFASWLAQQNESLLTIKELMGHRSIEMTMRYAHLCPGQKRDAVMKLQEGEL